MANEVHCNECLHFSPDTVGNGTGIGRCRIEGEGYGMKELKRKGVTYYQWQSPLYPRARRICKDFIPRRTPHGDE